MRTNSTELGSFPDMMSGSTVGTVPWLLLCSFVMWYSPYINSYVLGLYIATKFSMVQVPAAYIVSFQNL